MSNLVEEILKRNLNAYSEVIPKKAEEKSEISGWQEVNSTRNPHAGLPVSRYSKTPSVQCKSSRMSGKTYFHSLSSNTKSPRHQTKHAGNLYYTSQKYQLKKSQLLPIQRNKKNLDNSLVFFKRKMRLQDFCENQFILVDKSPPIVSGYSAIIYYK